MLTEALRLVLERHIEVAQPADLALWSLRGLIALDQRLEAVMLPAELRLTQEGRPLASLPLARLGTRENRGAPAALGGALSTFYEAAWQASPALRRAGSERVIASGFEELFNHLDPYSRYVTPTEARAAREVRVGQSGLGLRVGVRRNVLAVVALTPGGPAIEAGIREGDRLVAVDGRRLGPRDPGLAATLLEGPEGSEVTLTLARGRRFRDVTLTREVVVPETVTAERREGILWLRVSGFSVLTDRRITAELVDAFADQPPRGVVLDLRGNRGGLLSQAVAVADAFLVAGEVARTEGRHPDANRRYEAGGQDLAQGRPVVILVDGRTASAAEIVALGLAERGRGVVVGSATMGKGLIQLVGPLPNGAEILITWSQVVAPSGWPVQGIGILPAVCTSLGTEALATALARLPRGEVTMGPVLSRLRASRPPVQAAEMAALRGACPPAEGRAADLAAARALVDQPAAYLTALRPFLP